MTTDAVKSTMCVPALDWMVDRYRLPYCLQGSLFGSNVGFRACCGDARVHGLVRLGLPVRAEEGAITPIGFCLRAGPCQNSCISWRPR